MTDKDKAPKPQEAPFKAVMPQGTGKDSALPVAEEVGGVNGPEPTRYGDWERKGRVSDF